MNKFLVSVFTVRRTSNHLAVLLQTFFFFSPKQFLGWRQPTSKPSVLHRMLGKAILRKCVINKHCQKKRRGDSSISTGTSSAMPNKLDQNKKACIVDCKLALTHKEVVQGHRMYTSKQDKNKKTTDRYQGEATRASSKSASALATWLCLTLQLIVRSCCRHAGHLVAM